MLREAKKTRHKHFVFVKLYVKERINRERERERERDVERGKEN